MADSNSTISDAELVEQLRQYGEDVKLPIKWNKREILVKKLNHLKVRERQQISASTKNASFIDTPMARRSTRSSPRSTNINRSRTTRTHHPSHEDEEEVDLDNEEDTEAENSIRSNESSTYMSRSRSRFLRSSPSVAGGSTRSQSKSNLPLLDTFSSDDSDDAELSHSSANTFNHQSNDSSFSLNSKSVSERRRQSQFSNNILRTIRRRTGEQIPVQRSPKQRSFELNSDQVDSKATGSREGLNTSLFRNKPSVNGFTSSPNLDDFDNKPVDSPNNSNLYPSLKKFMQSTDKNQSEVFESSDSDLDACSSYEVENKSVNTSLPSGCNSSPQNSRYNLGSSNAQSTRSKLITRRRVTGRVQQYKSAITEHLPHCLLAIVIFFFISLLIMYTANHKDLIFSWLPSKSLNSNDVLLLCPDGLPSKKCYDKGEIERSIDLIKGLFDNLSQRKGEVLCETLKSGSEIMQSATLIEQIGRETISPATADRLYLCCIDHILANPHWNIRGLKEDFSIASKPTEVVQLESSVAKMGFMCRLMRSFTTVLYGICITLMVVGLAFCTYLWMQRKQKHQEKEQKEVYALVEKIIGVLQDHHAQSKKENSHDPPYLAVQHVRDQLLPPSHRKKLQPIFEKAFEFISAHESRIRLETRLIHGDEFEVWQWLPQTSTNGKIWQGQAFGELNENGSKEVKYSPTPCLKIRNMFDSNIECEDGWEASVIDSVLEKLEGVGPVVHICVDADSQEGLVYLKCASLETAGLARLALHGWWFDGRLVTVKHLKLDRYHKRWPEAINAHTPLHPSTNTNRSLSQPFHRSSLEMT